MPDESPVFEGHFPGHPLVPGVLLTETMAQASGYLVLGLMDFTHMPFLMAVDKARFRTFVGPGAVLAVDGEPRARRLGLRGDQGGDRGRRQADLRRRAALPRSMPFPAGLGRRRCAPQARRLGCSRRR